MDPRSASYRITESSSLRSSSKQCAGCLEYRISLRRHTTPKANGQVERYNRTIVAMLRNYVNEHQNDWDEFASVLTYAYNNHVHRSTGTTPFDLVLSRPPPAFSLYHNERGVRKPSEEQRDYYIEQLEATVQKAYDRLLKTQQRYKRDFDKRVRSENRNIHTGDYVYLDPTDGTTKGMKLANHALAPTESLRTTAGLSSSNVMTKWRGLTPTA